MIEPILGSKKPPQPSPLKLKWRICDWYVKFSLRLFSKRAMSPPYLRDQNSAQQKI